MRTIVLALAALGMMPLSLAAQARSQPDALVDTAMVRMGGRAALEKVARVRLDMMTQWLRTTWDREPGADAPSYELHAEVRDYAIPAWRNTRRFPVPGGGPWREMTDVVRDTVAIRRMATGAPGTVGATDARWQALNVAYVDERRELFAFAPERLLLAARAAADLKGRIDTTVNGVRYRAAAATVGGFPTVMLFDPATGFLAAALYAAAR